MSDALLDIDGEVFLYLNRLGTPGWDAFWLAVSDKWTALPLYLLLLWLTYRALGVRKTLVVLLTVALVLTISDQLANFFKYGIQRFRPCHNPDLAAGLRLVKESCGGKFSFYSAHASNTMAVATFFTGILGRRFRLLPPLLILWALVVGYSRIYLGVHYPFDIICGALAGSFIGFLFARLFALALIKWKL